MALAAGLAMPLSAQVPTEAQPGVIDRPAPVAPVQPGRKPVEIERLTPQPEQVPGADEIVATIKQINFKGLSVVDEADLQAALAKYLGRPITRGELAQLKFEVVRHYYDRGYILVRAVTPPKDLSDGILDIVVYEARIGNINVRNDDVLRPWVVDALTQNVKSGSVFHERAVESMVNDFNDFNNVDATLNLRQGKSLGTTDLLLSVVSADEDKQRVSVDNYGSDVAGDIVGTVNLEKSNLLGIGEKFDIDVTGTNGHTYSWGASAKLPVGYRNVMFDVRAYRSIVDVGDRLKSIDAKGDTEIFEAAFSSRLVNMRKQILQVRAGLQAREHQARTLNPINYTDDKIRQAFVETSYLARYPNLFLFGSLRLAKGLGILGANEMGYGKATNTKGRPKVALVQPLLFANYRPLDSGELRVQVSGQWANAVTLSSDLFTLGGYGSVRGFQPAETTGPAGVQFSVEYSHKVWSGDWAGTDWKASVGPFIDGGHVWNRQPENEVGVEDRTLLAVGLGAEVETGLTRIGRTILRLDWARPVGHDSSEQVESNSYYLRLTQTF